MPFQWPSTQQRLLILGSTGTGKSVLGAHALANAPFNRMPYIIVDYKNEGLLNSIHRAKYIDFKDTPKKPGIYILKALPDRDDEKVEAFLWRVLHHERTGLLFDEGYMIPNKGALNALYTQGRSKNIPIITLTQRPVWLTRFSFSEANHICYMRLNDKEDRKTVFRFVPKDAVWKSILEIDPPKFHSLWYDVDQHASFKLLPAPRPDDILQTFEDRMQIRRKVF